MIDRFLGDAFGVWSCQFWSTVLQSGAQLPIHTLKLLDRAVSGAQFLPVGVFECDIAHRRSVAVLCMLYKIRCKAMHPLNGALPGPYGQCGLDTVLWSHISTHIHRLAAEPHSRVRLLFPSWCPCGMILLTPYSMVWDWQVSKAGPMFFIILRCSIPSIIFYSFSLLFFPSIGWYCGAGVFGLIGCKSLSQPCTANLF